MFQIVFDHQKTLWAYNVVSPDIQSTSYVTLKQTSKAKKVLISALKRPKKTNTFKLNLNLELAQIHLNNKQYDKALKYYKIITATKISKKSPNYKIKLLAIAKVNELSSYQISVEVAALKKAKKH